MLSCTSTIRNFLTWARYCDLVVKSWCKFKCSRMFLYVRAMPMQVIPIFLGFDHCHPFQDKHSHDLSITGLGLPWLTFPGGQYLSYLESAIPYVDIPPAWVRHQGKPHHLPWNASPRGYQIVTLTIPLILRTNGSLLILLELPIEVISLNLYLTNPGSIWGEYLGIPPWFMVSRRAPRESCFRDTFP